MNTSFFDSSDLREDEGYFRSAFQQAPIGMAIVSLQGRWLKVNHRLTEMLGYSEAEMLATDFQHLTHPDDLAEDVNLMQRMLRGDIDTYQMPKRYLHRNGDTVWVLLTVSLVWDERHTTQRYFTAHIENITDRKQNEEALAQANTFRERVLSTLREAQELVAHKNQMLLRISHEFRTPLAIIRASSELLENYHDRMPVEKQMEKLRAIQRQIDRLHALLEDIALMGRGEAERMTVDYAPVDVPCLLRELSDETQGEMGRNHRLACSVNGEPAVVLTDRTLLTLIVKHLLSNAVKYAPAGSPVELEATTGAEIIIRVRDRGIGIPAEERERIFEPFFRASNTGETSGIGVGLYLAREAVTLLGGTIDVESSPGSTMFTVRLPVLESD